MSNPQCFFFFFFELYLAKYLQRGRGESQEHLMSNKSGVSIYDYGFHTVTIRINSKFEAGIPGLHSWEKKRTLHFNTTSNEQIIFSKSVSNLPSSFFTDWRTNEKKTHDLPISLFHVSSFHSPPPLSAWSSTFLRYQQPSPPEESQTSLAVVFWPNARVYNICL